MIGKIKMFTIGNIDINKESDIDKGINFLKECKKKFKGGKL